MYKLLTARTLIFRIALALGVLAAVCSVCLFIGPEKISLTKVFDDFAKDSLAGADYQIFVRIRLPRIILAAVVGAALAAAGVVFQAILRNPLADPYILGISSGAALGAIIAVVAGFSWTFLGRSPITLFAFAGALSTVWLVWFIGRLTAKHHITGLLLAGVVVNAFLSAVIMFITSIAKSDQVHSTMFWLMGNMTEEKFVVLWLAAGFVLAGVAALFFIAAQLNAVSFGSEDAKSMGINTARTQGIAFAVAAAITAVAVSLSGLVGFVGLIVPHTVRLLFGPDHRQLIPLAAIFGATFLIIADTLARIVVAPAQLPVGVVTAIVGGPFFLFLLIKHSQKVGWLGK